MPVTFDHGVVFIVCQNLVFALDAIVLKNLRDAPIHQSVVVLWDCNRGQDDNGENWSLHDNPFAVEKVSVSFGWFSRFKARCQYASLLSTDKASLRSLRRNFKADVDNLNQAFISERGQLNCVLVLRVAP